jgi:hypothetical protein
MFKKALEMRLEQAELFWPLGVILALTGLRISLTFVLSKAKAWQSVLKESLWPVVLVTGILGTLVLLLPWEYAKMDRYFYNLIGLILLYAAVELTKTVEVLTQVKHTYGTKMALTYVLVTLLASWVIRNVVFHGFGTRYAMVAERAIDAHLRLYKEYQLSYPLIKYLLTSVPDQATLFIGDEDYERIYHIGVFASHFDRRKIRVITTNQMVVTDFGGAYQFPSSDQSETLSAVFSKSVCTSDCYFIYRPAYYKPLLFGPLPPGQAEQFVPNDVAEQIGSSQRWHLIKR